MHEMRQESTRKDREKNNKEKKEIVFVITVRLQVKILKVKNSNSALMTPCIYNSYIEICKIKMEARSQFCMLVS